MATLIAGAVAVVVLYSLLQMFRSADPAMLARAARMGGGVLALAVAAFTSLRGELVVAIPLAFFGAGLLGWSPMANSSLGNLAAMFGGRGGQASRLQSPLLVLTIAAGSQATQGEFIAGPYAGRSLDAFTPQQLMAMLPGFDPDSAALLEMYLDRRFAGWRQHAQGDAAGRNGGARSAASTSKMSNEEAYEVLGLKPGATADEISLAHRRLMKKCHPDQGGTTYLASRVNAAKDTLLRTHRS
jgi:hypothetical protein